MTTDNKGSGDQAKPVGFPSFGKDRSLPSLPPLSPPRTLPPTFGLSPSTGSEPPKLNAPGEESLSRAVAATPSPAPMPMPLPTPPEPSSAESGEMLASGPLGPNLIAPPPKAAEPISVAPSGSNNNLPLGPVLSAAKQGTGSGSALTKHGTNSESAAFVSTAESSGELDWNEEEDLGEKTMMLAAPSDAEMEDLDGEKTQITLSAMEYDPLFGKLVVETGKAPQREYILVREATTIGRGTKNEVVIPDISMSRNHAVIDKFNEGFRLRDLESGNGTVVNGYRIRVAQLRDGDIIEIGSIRFRFEQSGGDPDELWRGEAKIDYHPNQKKGAAPSQSSPAMSPSHQMTPAYAEAAASIPSSPQPAPVMESMLQRPGGIAAPSWNEPAWGGQVNPQYPPMGAAPVVPYGQVSPNSLRSINRPPIWLVAVLIATLILFIVSSIFLLTSFLKSQSKKSEIEAENERWKEIEKSFQEGAVSYSNKQIKDAKNSFQRVLTLDAENALVPIYLDRIAKEEDVESVLQRVRQKLQNRTITREELEETIAYYKKVTQESPYYHDIRVSYLPDIQMRYARRLREDIREKIGANELSEASVLIAKLGTLEGTEGDVSTLSKLLEDKQSQSQR